MSKIDELRGLGADTEEGLARCLGREDFYLRMVKMGLAGTGFEELDKCIKKGDLEGGFEAAHALKGILGNLSLTNIYTPVCEITELLRARKEQDYSVLLQQIADERKKTAALFADEAG